MKTTILGLSVLLVAFVAVGGFNVHAAGSSEGAYRQLGVYSEVLQRIQSEYVEEPNVPQVTTGALHGLLESLDADSSYLTPEEYKQYKEHQTAAKGDLGMTVSKRFGYATVVAVIPGGPADKAGIEDGDILEAVGSRSTHDMSLAAIREDLAGAPGTSATFSLVRPRRVQPEKMSLTRAIVQVPALKEQVYDGNTIGYLAPEELTKERVKELAEHIRALQRAGVKKILLDLRDVSVGGYDEGVATANLFLKQGTIASIEGQKVPKQVFAADPQKDVTTLPVTVLVNHGTYGAAEIAAAAILDNHRGDVVGDKTFGEGAQQKLIEMPNGAALILTVAKYESPSGKILQDNAVTPNVVVASAEDQLPVVDDEDATPETTPQANQPKQPKEDLQLKKALEVTRQKNG